MWKVVDSNSPYPPEPPDPFDPPDWLVRVMAGLGMVALISGCSGFLAWAILKVRAVLVAFGLLALVACGFNPAEGDFGVVAVKPEQDSCWVKVRGHGPDGVQNQVTYAWRPCDGAGHDLEVMGRRW